jgi:hypothetical protein
MMLVKVVRKPYPEQAMFDFKNSLLWDTVRKL